MATSKTAPPSPDSFPITLAEFVSGLPVGKVESAKAFKTQLSNETGGKTAKEWDTLFTHFGNKPSDIPWSQWKEQLAKQAEVPSNG